ncbi:class I SAM-dependent methyltransferase [Rhodospirillaceae bacterium KN72]|uniref:Class I SAM-dependent methyltransferase n=1 Tax=Pacificispira spongiicola TaxID=2729598 RepID=A0A7Y0HGA5_9PROT|nr:class I SAM-dependent methyltransferase [Pacificispira spongiicola]NMM46715.1 class I SAM-dependent methyltransferase [Pacificispira spongiicola]
MGRELNLLSALPKAKRNIEARLDAKNPETMRISKEYGEMYFDGPRDYGYGGYKYDGRWVPVAKDIIAHFGLKAGDRVLDVGCAKGFLVKDLVDALPGLEVYGLDISEYAMMNCHPNVVGRLHLGSADHLPFPDGAFSAVISLDTIHNLPRARAKTALQEIQRLSNGNAFVRVDSYRTPEQKAVFENWVLTAEFHDYPDGWVQLFDEAGYTGDYYWTIIE